DRNMIGLVALDFVLGILLAGVVRVSLVVGVAGMHLDDRAADAPGLGIPGHVVADLEFSAHGAGTVFRPSSSSRNTTASLCASSRAEYTSVTVPLRARARN